MTGSVSTLRGEPIRSIAGCFGSRSSGRTLLLRRHRRSISGNQPLRMRRKLYSFSRPPDEVAELAAIAVDFLLLLAAARSLPADLRRPSSAPSGARKPKPGQKGFLSPAPGDAEAGSCSTAGHPPRAAPRHPKLGALRRIRQVVDRLWFIAVKAVVAFALGLAGAPGKVIDVRFNHEFQRLDPNYDNSIMSNHSIRPGESSAGGRTRPGRPAHGPLTSDPERPDVINVRL